MTKLRDSIFRGEKSKTSPFTLLGSGEVWMVLFRRLARCGLPLACFGLLYTPIATGQTPQPVSISNPAPNPVTQVSAAIATGPSGAAAVYYWVVARYSSGYAYPTTQSYAVAAYSGFSVNTVRVSWSAPAATGPSVTGYDVLRSFHPEFPLNNSGNSCSTC